LISAFFLSTNAKADWIVYEGHTGNAYTYDLRIDNSGAFFLSDGFEITGLQGVTNATLSSTLASIFDPLGGVSFTSNSVTVETGYGFTGLYKEPFSIGTLTIYSNALPGNANFSILDSNGYNAGRVTGPTSPTPEPSSLMLLGTGLFSAAGIARKKFFA
jgi:hypothetical protein